MTTQDKIAALIAQQTEREAAAVYSALRIEHARASRAGEDHAAGLMQVMVMAGDALEARIGEERFDALMDQIDAHIYA